MIGKLRVYRIWLLILPGFIFVCVLLFLPMAHIIIGSLKGEEGWTFSNYLRAFSKSAFQISYIRTLKLGTLITVLAIVIGYPTAYIVYRSKWKGVMMSLALIPLMTTAVVRTFAWFVVLGRNGLINQVLKSLGIIESSLKLLYTEGAIVVGLLQLFFPLMLFSLISSMENISTDIEEAARSLGATPLQAFFAITLPLSMDGMIIGSILVFAGSISAYTTPAILGGTRVLMLSTLLYQRAMTLMDWNGAMVIAVVMFLSTLIINWLLRRLRREMP
ncbi:MAG: ABC transporter permease [Candidatus Aminicenantes bacterium]|nr:MAG: ABC transporter permease [Candidatus Aminicenantes bacterium]